jgi:hypothetical protein
VDVLPYRGRAVLAKADGPAVIRTGSQRSARASILRTRRATSANFMW